MKKNLISIVAVAIIVAAAVTTTAGRAANLNQAASTLSDDEEWSIMAHAAIGHSIGSGYLRSALNDSSATDYEKRILAITALGQNPRTWGNENFIDSLLKKFDGNQMGDANLLNDDIFGLLALRSAGESGDVINKLRNHIQANQNSDGGWSFSRGGSSDSNTTAMAIAALRSAGASAGSGTNYILSTQDSSGGFGFTRGQAADGASTAWGIIGLHAAGNNAPHNATAYLESLQLPNGAFKWKPTDSSGSDLVTAYAIIALSGKSLPINTVSNTNTSQPTPTVAGNGTTNPNPQPTPTPTINYSNNAGCVSITAPDQVTVGQSFFTTITVKNTGTSAWTIDSTPHRLGSQNPQDAHTWGASRINLPVQPITPSQSVTFTFTAKAPNSTGVVPFAWQPLEEAVEWFGQSCSKNITVINQVLPTPAPSQPTIPLQPQPTPTPTIQPTSFPTPNPQPPQTLNSPQTSSSFYTTITYLSNKIYVGHTTFTNTTFTASNGQNYSYSNPRAIGTLISATNEINLLYEIKDMSFGPFVYGINGYIPNGADGWLYAVNGIIPNVSAADYLLKPGDRVQWFYGGPNSQPY